MSSVLIDTNVFVRLANTSDAQYSIAVNAVARLRCHGHRLCVAPQNLIEFRNVATRAISANGLGMLPADADAESVTIESLFDLIPESDQIFPAWKLIVQSTGVIGKQVHDARLIATCHVAGLTHILTFNVGHFQRFASLAPGIVVVDPASV